MKNSGIDKDQIMANLLADHNFQDVKEYQGFQKSWNNLPERIRKDLEDNMLTASCPSLEYCLEHAKKARKKLKDCYEYAYDIPEINLSNYRHEDVEDLNNRSLELFDMLEVAIADLNEKYGDFNYENGEGEI